jgi:hypothetical protein
MKNKIDKERRRSMNDNPRSLVVFSDRRSVKYKADIQSLTKKFHDKPNNK